MKKFNWPAAIVSLAVVGLVAYALVLTHSLWSLLGLCVLGIFYKSPETECPKCGHQFMAQPLEEEE